MSSGSPMSVKLILKVGIVLALLSLFVLGIFAYWTRSRLPLNSPPIKT